MDSLQRLRIMSNAYQSSGFDILMSHTITMTNSTPNSSSSASSNTSSTDDSVYTPSTDAVLFFTYFICGTLGAMVFLLVIVLYLQYVGGQSGEHFRIFKHILRHGRWSEQTSRKSMKKRRNAEFDDEGRILQRSDDDEENIDENGDFDNDAFSMNVPTNQNDTNLTAYSLWSRWKYLFVSRLRGY